MDQTRDYAMQLFTGEIEMQHDVHEETTYERAAREKKYLVQEMMGEQYDNYFWDEKHAL